MAKLSDQQRCALRLLARSPYGCTEVILLAHGFDLATRTDAATNPSQGTMAGLPITRRNGQAAL
jgi:hypothetical protein